MTVHRSARTHGPTNGRGYCRSGSRWPGGIVLSRFALKLCMLAIGGAVQRLKRG